ncbi:LPS export ABC transporter periplasmic protein LptC [Desulfosediminicola flagellatus]|uniref:LPS export ABC transporter periplasmic protein LptC n=1 Tax=Desulfosediminicola flagellatus TaxID=2569541 RepID=UPI0010AC5CB0|nr:LPS export ABC transporter periplasmic protein LptC [Desulfosediminicola flagellatus]
MMIKRRNLIWLIPLGLIITFPVWRIPIGNFLTPRVSYDKKITSTRDLEAQNFNMETVRILQSKNGRMTAEIHSKSAFTTEKPNEYILDQVNADLFNNEGEATNVVAERGIFNGSTQHLTLMDNVVITKPAADQHLYTDLFYYDDETRMVNCPGKTRIEGETIEVVGTSLDYDVERGYYEMGGRVLCLIEGSISP